MRDHLPTLQRTSPLTQSHKGVMLAGFAAPSTATEAALGQRPTIIPRPGALRMLRCPQLRDN